MVPEPKVQNQAETVTAAGTEHYGYSVNIQRVELIFSEKSSSQGFGTG
jgi:hypothetical protein